MLFNGYRDSVWEDEKVLEIGVVMIHKNVNVQNATELTAHLRVVMNAPGQVAQLVRALFCYAKVAGSMTSQ